VYLRMALGRWDFPEVECGCWHAFGAWSGTRQ
jgi:hypothetical protein